jgi:AcrR family transcriptional regulator
MERLIGARQKSAAKSRTSILRAAERLFSEQGYRATTLRQISRSSRANGALVSYYFGSKEGLRDAVLERKLASLEKILQPLAAEGEISPQDLALAVRAIFRHVREDEHFHRLALRASLEDGEFKKDMSARLGKPVFERLSGLIRKASGLSQEKAEVRCLVLMGMIHQYANLHCFHREELGSPLAAYENYVADSIVKEICRA